MRISKLNILAVAMSVCLGLTACGNSSSERSAETNKSAKSSVQKSDLPVYTVAMNIDYPPFEFIGEDGKVDGFDVDLLNAIAEKEQFEVRYEPYGFSEIIESVKTGKEDMSASSIFITPERQESVDFSQIYFTMPMYVVGLEKEGRPKNIEEFTDKTIALDKNFLLKKIMKETFTPQGNEALIEETNFLAFEKMVTGQADVMLENIMTINDYTEMVKDTKLFYMRLPDENSIKLGYITQKGNQELIDKLNNGLATIKADGTYDKVYNKWFGKLEAQVAERTSASVESVPNPQE